MNDSVTNITMNIKRSVLVFGVLLVTLPGCAESPGSKLIGRWQGRPENAQDRAKDNSSSGQPTGSTGDAMQSVLEKFDFTMTLDFVDASRVRMVLDLAGQNQSKPGSWRVVSSTAESVTIEVTPAPSESGVPTSGSARQFSLHFKDKNKNRFRLTEVNADESLGAILFERNSSK